MIADAKSYTRESTGVIQRATKAGNPHPRVIPTRGALRPH